MFNPFDLDAMRAMHFGQHMQPIEKMAVESAQEIRRLEDALEGDVKCCSLHKTPTNRHCTREVTHRFRDCTHPNGAPVCVAHVVAKEASMQAGRRCSQCLRPAADCWRIEPFG